MNHKKIDELRMALKAYTQSENNQTIKNPDLYFNRASIFAYLEDYQNGLNQYTMAMELDKKLNCDDIISKTIKKLHHVNSLIERKV